METEAPDRHFILAGSCNFRDLGGYPTDDGGMVKWRTIFRSGVLDGLIEDDCVRIRALGITNVIDLRANGEREQRPSRAIGAETWARDYTLSRADHSRSGAVATPDQLRGGMIAAYGAMLDEQAESYRQLFATLASAPGPVLFHCTGGKDRTGIGAAVLLDLLGVARDLITEDYALTNHCLKRDSAALADAAARWPRELRIAAPDYLAAMFARLDTEFGGAAGYLGHLGLGTDTIDQLHHHYVEARG